MTVHAWLKENELHRIARDIELPHRLRETHVVEIAEAIVYLLYGGIARREAEIRKVAQAVTDGLSGICKTETPALLRTTGPEVKPERLRLGIEAAEKALVAHSRAVGSFGEPEAQVWPLLASLHEYCALYDIDLDGQLATVRQQIATREIELPLSRSSQTGCRREASRLPPARR